ncbi:hypothetical protein GCM10010218_16670 [Streptomyces mashuensis]|uniref:Uncharacterized protein n=1 Tax=Streptomyces mashuensis TaxID=33904 RepID=A0A919B2B8_9ACTN|nr:hypothetical protein [Streptomyces mashuensis]GHF35897.1 hypothetical protein GCM10010218_16670 [Streptomyces mashuensis]
MAVAGPTGPALSREEVDRALARLGAEHEAVESSLLALQDHAGRRLLEGAELTGVTKSRWAVTEQLVTQLWICFDAYTDALQAARELRGRRRWPTSAELSELTDLLRGSAVTLPGGPPHAAVTVLGGPPRLSERLSLQELLDRMNEWYAQALAVVVSADAVWSALPARIDLLAAELRRVRALAHSVGVRPGEHPAGDDLDRITAELAALRAEVVADPLAFWSEAPPGAPPGTGRPDTVRYDRAALALEEVRREVEAVLDVRQDAEQRLMRVRDVLSRADRTLGEARRARVEVLSKIAASEVPAVSGPPTVLYEQLAVASDHRRNARWHRLSPLLEGLEQRAEEELLRARESLTAVTAPLAVRAELRGRLDAYKAKAARHGVAEDACVVERYDLARRMLWSAPCDLVAAEQAVLRHQQAVAEALAGGRVPAQAGPERAQGLGLGQSAAVPVDHEGEA